MKYIDENLTKEFRTWLTSPDNPDYLGTQRYDQYDYYFNRLIEKAVDLGLVNPADVNVEDLAWLSKFQEIFDSNVALKNLDEKSIGHRGGSASLKKFINFIQFKNSGGKIIMTAEERKELFKKYMKDCGTCNELSGQKGKAHANTLDGYWFGLSNRVLLDANIQPFSYDDDLTFEPVKEQILQLDKGGDPSQGAKWYSKYLAECKFKKLLEWFVKQIRINNDIEIGKKTQGKGADGNSIRNLYGRWRVYVGFELDCSVRLGYQSAQSGSNYIHLTDTWLNIIPVFTQANGKSDVTGLKIVYKPDNKLEREYPSVTVQALGLFDGNYPNEQLRKLFENFKNEIAAVQGGIALPSIRVNSNGEDGQHEDYELNLILYGPPGTGKTYHTVIKAVEIIDGNASDNFGENLNRFRELIKEDRIAFTTFHQAYGYEEFIEGIKPDLDSDEVKYKLADGVFKEFCKAAREIKQTKSNDQGLIKSNATVWKISLDSAGRKGFELHDRCLEDSYIRVGWDADEDLSLVTEDGKVSAKRFIDDMEIGDIVLSCWSQSEIDAIGVITGEYEWHDDEPRLKRFRKVRWLRTWRGKEKYNIKAVNHGKNLSQQAVYRLQISIDDIIKILNENPQEVKSNKIEYNYDKPYVFIIDEINRGNVSKIFGELITLIEPTKRLGAEEEMTCTLPYSGVAFGVPKNVYILGTMNTADRSLVQLDAALRRRFAFEEMMPKPELLKVTQDGIDLNQLLAVINKRIAALLDREHQIGHSYFIKLDENATVLDVQRIFKKNVLPLLQEYFFDDYESIQKILGEEFVGKQANPFNNGKTLYEIKCPDLPSAYQEIYGGTNTTSVQADE